MFSGVNDDVSIFQYENLGPDTPFSSHQEYSINMVFVIRHDDCIPVSLLSTITMVDKLFNLTLLKS